MADILRQLSHGGPYDSMTDVAVIETGRLNGMIAIEQLFTTSPDTPASVIMNHNPPVIGPGADQESAAAKATSHEESCLGVVDINGTFLGLIPPNRILGVLPEERREDMAV